jgi:hypothetical protein
MKQKAIELIDKHSKVWLAEKLDISRPTLDKRLLIDNWKKPEMQLILMLK